MNSRDKLCNFEKTLLLIREVSVSGTSQSFLRAC